MKIVAPAGSIESFNAAMIAGADEIYMGIKGFGARRNAPNFHVEEYVACLEKAHLKGIKVLLTLNTIMRDVEIEALSENIKKLYIAGLDAIIVQDLGLFSYLKKNFPDIPLHASTQMNASSAQDINFLSRVGFERIILPRELSLEQIKNIRKNSKAELEVFVSGALCISISGRCYMSSAVGNRSGNRGMCTQGCRKCYSSEGKKKFFLSPKDQIANESTIQALLETGVDAIKIEGRMKSPEYVFYVVSSIKAMCEGRYTDAYAITKLFNRGYSLGYFKGDNPKLMNTHFSAHMGEEVGKIERGRIHLSKPIHQADGVVMVDKNFERVGGGFVNQIFYTCSYEDKFLKTNQNTEENRSVTLYRNYDYLFELELQKALKESIRKINVKGKLNLRLGESILTFTYGEYEVSESIQVVEEAKNPTKIEVLKEKIEKSGSEDFEVSVEIKYDGKAFLPLSELKELRRRALEQLKNVLVKGKRRIAIEGETEVCSIKYVAKKPKFCALYMTLEQKKAVEKFKFIEFSEMWPNKILEEGQKYEKNIFATHYFELEGKNVKIDEIMNIFNSYGVKFYENFTTNTLYVSPEMSFSEIEKLKHKNPLGIVVYGKQAVMNFSSKVEKAFEFKKLSNEFEDEYSYIRYKNQHMLMSEKARNLYPKIDELLKYGVEEFRFDFTTESYEEVVTILENIKNMRASYGHMVEPVL
ncbi:MAG: U32 family peptidase [Fusobacteria bacterium]|nr:U32 family peptidase [Fusobacteriota bacterium]